MNQQHAAAQPRPVVVAVGAVTSQGRGAEATWEGVRDGSVAIRTVQRLSTEGIRTDIAGEVAPLDKPADRAGYPEGYDDPALDFALIAAEEAMAAAEGLGIEPERWGLVLGTCNAGLLSAEQWYLDERAGREGKGEALAYSTPQGLAEVWKQGKPPAHPALDALSQLPARLQALAGQTDQMARSLDSVAGAHQGLRLAAAIGTKGPESSTLDDGKAPLAAMHRSVSGTVAGDSLDGARGDAAAKHTEAAAGKVPHPTDPVVLMAARAGLAQVAGQHLQYTAGEAVHWSSGKDQNLAVMGALRLHTGQGLGIVDHGQPRHRLAARALDKGAPQRGVGFGHLDVVHIDAAAGQQRHHVLGGTDHAHGDLAAIGDQHLGDGSARGGGAGLGGLLCGHCGCSPVKDAARAQVRRSPGQGADQTLIRSHLPADRDVGDRQSWRCRGWLLQPVRHAHMRWPRV